MLTVTPLCTCGHPEKHHYSVGIPACRQFGCRCPRYQAETDMPATEPQPSLFALADSLGVGV